MIQGKLQLTSQHQKGWRTARCCVWCCSVMEQSTLQCHWKREAVCHLCSEPVLECLVESFDATISLWMVESRSNVLDSPPLHEGSKVGRDELGPIISGDGIRNASVQTGMRGNQ